MKLCDYGCGQEGIYQLGNGKWCCNESQNSCQEVRKKFSKSHMGKNKENNEGRRRQAEKRTGRTKETHEYVRNQAEKMTGRTKESHEGVRKQSEKLKGRTKETYEGIRRSSEKIRRWMLSGGAAYLNSFIQNPSKEELKLRTICQKILPYVESNYPIYRVGRGKRSYNIDIAVPKLNLAIEYDGYFHFCDQEHVEYHKKRQKELEKEGWKFIRYNIFQKFPTLEQVKEDILKILKNGRTE